MKIYQSITFFFSLLCLSASAWATQQLAPDTVKGMVFYGKFLKQGQGRKHFIFKFRAPFDKDQRIAFYHVTKSKANIPANSGIYQYQKLNSNTARVFYASQKGLKPHTYFINKLYFKRNNAGSMTVESYRYKNNKPVLNPKQDNLVHMHTYHGSFYFK